jgi:hypothetical protein
MDQVLTRQQAELVALERRLVLQVRDALASAEGARADLERLAGLVTEMDELFLLVVAGEYNAGKSTFINALLGDEVFAMGDLPPRAHLDPAPRRARPARAVGEHVRVLPLPARRAARPRDRRHPGHQLHRAHGGGDHARLRARAPTSCSSSPASSSRSPPASSVPHHIREWGKKVIFVVNGVDRRNSDEQLDRVREYRRSELSSPPRRAPCPTAYFGERCGAARELAARARERGGRRRRAPPQRPRTRATRFAARALPARHSSARVERRAPQAPSRPGGRAAPRALTPKRPAVAAAATRCATDAQLSAACATARAYSAEMRTDLGALPARAARRARRRRAAQGAPGWSGNIRVGNINLRATATLENRFRGRGRRRRARGRSRTWCSAWSTGRWAATSSCGPASFAELDAHTRGLRASGALAAHADTEFQYNREELFARLRQPVERRLDAFNAEAEAREVVESMREAVTQAFGVNVFALGLGAVLVAVFTTAALDVTGVLTATLFAVAGWLIIPARRRRLVHDLEEKIAKLSADLSALLAGKFQEQLARYEQQLLEVIQPYERFLEAERAKLERAVAELGGARGEVEGLERRIAAAFPEGAEPRS